MHSTRHITIMFVSFKCNIIHDNNILMAVTVSDRVFDMDSDNDAIFTDMVYPIINGALDGINGTVFAYGQTSSGE